MSDCPACQGTGYIESMEPTCCGNVYKHGECRSHCAVPKLHQEPCQFCTGKPEGAA